MFRINKTEFDVAVAEISAMLTLSAESADKAELDWFLSVEAAPYMLGDSKIAPWANVDCLPIAITSWTQFDGISPSIDGGLDVSVTDTGCGKLYVFEHTVTRQNRLTIGGRHGNSFDLCWDAVGDVYAGDELDVDLPLSIRIPIRFIGVEVRREVDVERTTELLARHLDIDELIIPEASCQRSSSSITMIFRPKLIP